MPRSAACDLSGSQRPISFHFDATSADTGRHLRDRPSTTEGVAYGRRGTLAEADSRRQPRPPRYGNKGDYRCGVADEDGNVCGQPVRTPAAWLCADHATTWRRTWDLNRKRDQRGAPLRFYGTQSGWLSLEDAIRLRTTAEQLVAGAPALLQKIHDAYAVEEPHTYRAIRQYDLLARVLLQLLPKERATLR